MFFGNFIPTTLSKSIWNTFYTSIPIPTPSISTSKLVLLNFPPHLPHLIVRPQTLEKAIQEARDLFKLDYDVSLLFTVMWEGRRVALTATSWDVVLLQWEGKGTLELELEIQLGAPAVLLDLIERKRKLEEMTEDSEQTVERRAAVARRMEEGNGPAASSSLSTSASASTSNPQFGSGSGKVTLVLRSPGQSIKDVIIQCTRNTPASRIIQRYAEQLNLRREQLRFLIDGLRIGSEEKVGTVLTKADPIREGTYELDVAFEAIGGKPVIYLFPPTTINASVRLSLVPSWKFSAIYPLTKVTTTKSKEETLTWNVTASPDGTLATPDGDTLSYLFWEAHTVTPIRPELDCTASISSLTSFDPLRPNLTSSNSILLPFEPFLRHLSSALKSLTLHTSARNDFITYWLPSFIAIRDRGQHILMRFLEQEQYEKAAPLEVEPKPDVVTRVFMIFKGVDESECWEEKWKEAREFGEKVDWRKVVGVSEVANVDGKFRVLEWGGLEVVR